MKTGCTSGKKNPVLLSIRFALFLNFIRKQAAPQERNTPSLLSIRFALFLNFIRKQAAPQERKTVSLLSIRFALFLYRLKWKAFLSVLIIRDLPSKSMLPYEFHMDFSGYCVVIFEVFKQEKRHPRV